ncbi:MAG: ankyrin repeat domain-containing protein [Parachlamydiaceae bacterium]|nr:ankyrin repeat domain-containing protein [Parachlamydiaceae bacterium]
MTSIASSMFPKDLSCEIFSYLEAKDLIAAGNTSKFLDKETSDDTVWRPRFKKRNSGNFYNVKYIHDIKDEDRLKLYKVAFAQITRALLTKKERDICVSFQSHCASTCSRLSRAEHLGLNYYIQMLIARVVQKKPELPTTTESIICFPQEDIIDQFQSAAASGLRKVVDEFIFRGIDINCRNRNQKTALHHLGMTDPKCCMVDELIARGADIKAVDQKGWTPLHWAACYRNETAIKALLKHGANNNALNNEGLTPVKIAKIEDAKEYVIDLLTIGEKGADKKIKSYKVTVWLSNMCSMLLNLIYRCFNAVKIFFSSRLR